MKLFVTALITSAAIATSVAADSPKSQFDLNTSREKAEYDQTRADHKAHVAQVNKERQAALDYNHSENRPKTQSEINRDWYQ